MRAQALVASYVAAGKTAGGFAALADAEFVVVLFGAEGADFFGVGLEVVHGDYGEVPEELHGLEV